MRWITLMKENRVLEHNMEEISDWAMMLMTKRQEKHLNMSSPICKGFFSSKQPDTPPNEAVTCPVYVQSFMEDLCKTVANLL